MRKTHTRLLRTAGLVVTAGAIALSGAVAAAAARAAAGTLDWTKQSPATSPSARGDASMAYDTATGNMVLFGGASQGVFGDTWTWNGSTWVKQSPAKSPSARGLASMAYDAATGNVVLFGGLGNSRMDDDTWTWNGSTWAKLSPAKSPPALFGASMTYDAATKSVVLFGGDANLTGGTSNATWTWNGSTWVKQSPAKSPAARSDASMAYDAATGNVVLFGGLTSSETSGTPYDDTWTWNGSTWAKQAPAKSPSARGDAAMAYDAATGNMVLFGGHHNYEGSVYGDTWTWNGSTWAKQSPAKSPPALYGASMAYDPATSDVVMFGGGSSAPGNSTWTWG